MRGCRLVCRYKVVQVAYRYVLVFLGIKLQIKFSLYKFTLKMHSKNCYGALQNLLLDSRIKIPSLNWLLDRTVGQVSRGSYGLLPGCLPGMILYVLYIESSLLWSFQLCLHLSAIRNSCRFFILTLLSSPTALKRIKKKHVFRRSWFSDGATSTKKLLVPMSQCYYMGTSHCNTIL